MRFSRVTVESLYVFECVFFKIAETLQVLLLKRTISRLIITANVAKLTA